MPAGLPATPWLQGADPAQHFMQAYQAGAQISEANARLQSQANQSAMEMEVRQREHQQQALMEQQKMEIEKSYQQAQLGLTKQRLQEAGRMNDMRIQQASQALQAQGKYQQDYQAFRDQGVPEGNASIKAALQNPGFLQNGGLGLAAVSRAAQATVPKNLEIKKDQAGTFYRSSPTEQYHIVPGGAEDRVLAHQPAIAGFKSVGEMEKELRTPGGKEADKEVLKKSISAEKQRLNEIYAARRMPSPYPEAARPKLDKVNALLFLNEAKGDKEKARQMAKDAGYDF